MNKKINEIILQLVYESLLLIKQACADVKQKNKIILEFEMASDANIETVYELCTIFGGKVKNCPATAREFVYDVKNLKLNELFVVKQFFEYAYNVSKKMEYYTVCQYIDIIIDYRKTIFDCISEKYNSYSTEEKFVFLNMISNDKNKMLSDDFDDFIMNMHDIKSELSHENVKIKK